MVTERNSFPEDENIVASEMQKYLEDGNKEVRYDALADYIDKLNRVNDHRVNYPYGRKIALDSVHFSSFFQSAMLVALIEHEMARKSMRSKEYGETRKKLLFFTVVLMSTSKFNSYADRDFGMEWMVRIFSGIYEKYRDGNGDLSLGDF